MNRHNISILLITASLVLLGAFLFLFLKKSWEDEVAALQKETSHLFIRSIHGIEGEVLDKIVFNRLHGDIDSSKIIIRQRTLPNLSKDSAKVIAFVGEHKTMVKTDSTFNVQVRAFKRPDSTGESDISGSLSMVIELTDDSWVDDSSGLPGHRKNILPLIEDNFKKAVDGSGLPVAYKVVRFQNDTVLQQKALLTGTYTDLPSGQRFAAELSDYRGYIFRKILPELLFSLGLFGCTGLAFFTIFNNLQAQRRLTELKNDFIQNVTHELKTPIATVGVAIEALRDFDGLKDPERTREYLDISRLELNRLSLLVDKVLQMSLFEKAEPEINPEALDLKSLVAEILASMKLQFEKAGAQVGFEANGENFSLDGDRLHLASVVYNLLDNALKYSTGSPKIGVQLETGNNRLQLKVSDNGMSIPAAYRDKIFDKFFRVPAGDLHNVKGHGLGLSYVASVIEKHGGTIAIESAEGTGTTFTVTLPQNNETMKQ